MDNAFRSQLIKTILKYALTILTVKTDEVILKAQLCKAQQSFLRRSFVL